MNSKCPELYDHPSLFKLNMDAEINIIEFYDPDDTEKRGVSEDSKYRTTTKIFWIDNFYERPDIVYEYLNSIEPPLWKIEQTPTNNTVLFEDRRHIEYHPKMIELYSYLSLITNQLPFCKDEVITNYTRLSKCKENNYHDNYWWPHHDSGYNGICYFMDDENPEIGTNIYKPKFYDKPELVALDENGANRLEHWISWTKKDYWEVLFSLRAKWNRFVMFDGFKYYHGMDLSDDRYFADHWSNAPYRVNQVFFLSERLEKMKKNYRKEI